MNNEKTIYVHCATELGTRTKKRLMDLGLFTKHDVRRKIELDDAATDFDYDKRPLIMYGGSGGKKAPFWSTIKGLGNTSCVEILEWLGIPRSLYEERDFAEQWFQYRIWQEGYGYSAHLLAQWKTKRRSKLKREVKEYYGSKNTN